MEGIQRVYIVNLNLWVRSRKMTLSKGQEFIEGKDDIPEEIYENLMDDITFVDEITGQKTKVIDVEERILKKEGENSRNRIISELRAERKVDKEVSNDIDKELEEKPLKKKKKKKRVKRDMDDDD